MIYFNAATLCIVLLLAHSVAIAQAPGEASEPSREELDAKFGAAEYEAMKARYSDEVPDTSGAVTPSDLLADAELVIEGTVLNIYYTYEGEYNQPYTHVEFDVSRVLKGELPGNELTVTQMGGPSQDGSMGNIVSDTEHFHVNTKELLFLETKKSKLRVKDRFCIEEEMLYDADGFPITMSEGGALGISRERNTAPRFSIIDMGTHVLYKNFSDPEEIVNVDYDNDGVPVEAPSASGQAAPVTLGEFVRALDR